MLASTFALGVALSACGTSLVSSAATTASPATIAPQSSTTTTSLPAGEVAVAFPVVECTTATGASLGTEGWKPGVLLAPIPTALVGKVEFYSDDVHTVLGPTAWACAQTQASDGGSGLVVYPSANPNPPVDGQPPPGTEGVFATFDTTATVAGISLVCPFFTVASWQQQEAKCPTSLPAGEQSSMPTPDVASVTDPAGVMGTLEGSGGTGAVTGTVVFPQVEPAVTDGSSVHVAEESCSLPDPTLCATVLSDFDVREFPVPTPDGASYGSRYVPGSSSPAAYLASTLPVRSAPTKTTVATRPAATQTTQKAAPAAIQTTQKAAPGTG